MSLSPRFGDVLHALGAQALLLFRLSFFAAAPVLKSADGGRKSLPTARSSQWACLPAELLSTAERGAAAAFGKKGRRSFARNFNFAVFGATAHGLPFFAAFEGSIPLAGRSSCGRSFFCITAEARVTSVFFRRDALFLAARPPSAEPAGKIFHLRADTHAVFYHGWCHDVSCGFRRAKRGRALRQGLA